MPKPLLRPYCWAWAADGCYFELFNGKKPKSPPEPWKKSEGKWVKVIIVPYKSIVVPPNRSGK